MVTYQLIQNGIVEVEVSGPKDQAWKEIQHYAMMYSTEGKIIIKEKK